MEPLLFLGDRLVTQAEHSLLACIQPSAIDATVEETPIVYTLHPRERNVFFVSIHTDPNYDVALVWGKLLHQV